MMRTILTDALNGLGETFKLMCFNRTPEAPAKVFLEKSLKMPLNKHAMFRPQTC